MIFPSPHPEPHDFVEFRSASSIFPVFYNVSAPAVEIPSEIAESDHFLRLHRLQWRIPLARELLWEIAVCSGQSLNASAIGRCLDISCHTVFHRVAAFEDAGLVRVLPSLAGRRPHVLLRDYRLLQALGGSGLSVLRTCLTERITAAWNARAPSTRWFQWEAGTVKRIDLIASTQQESVGFHFVEGLGLRKRDVAPLRLGLQRGVIRRGFLLHCGSQAFITARAVVALPAPELLASMDQWLACGSFREARELLRSRLAARGCIRQECLIQTRPLTWEERTASLP